MNDESWKRKYALLIALTISVMSAFILLFLMICFSFFDIRTMEGSMLVGLTLPTVISLYLLPKLFQRILDPKINRSANKMFQRWKAILSLTGFGVLYIMICWEKFESIPMMLVIIVHYTVVSLGEEFTYRKLILGILDRRYKTWIVIVVSAFMFAFILHISEDFVINLLIRFPMGIVFGCITVKTDTIAYTIVLHTIYNLIMLIL